MGCSGHETFANLCFHRVSINDGFTFSHYQPSEDRTNLTKEVAMGLEELAEFAAEDREMSMSANESISDLQEVVIETPRGSRNKYKMDEQTGRIKLSKVMPEGMVFPFDFGYFPGTKGEDGDPLDVLVLSDEPTFPGCQVACRLVGVMLARQKEKIKEVRNDRIVAIAEASVLYSEVKQLGDLSPVLLKQIDDFFVNYQRVRDIEVTPLGHDGPDRAKQLLERASAKR
jgi:inorganic pyrophosphatase